MIDKRKFYINGKWIDPNVSKDFVVINPSNENAYAVISIGSKKDVDIAVDASKEAFSKWSVTEKKDRIELLEKLLSIYKARWDEITYTMSEEMGAPLDWCSSAQTALSLIHI